MNAQNSSKVHMAKVNIVTGCILITFCLVALIWLIPVHIEAKGEYGAGLSPRLFPYIAATSLLVLSFILLISNTLKLRTPSNLTEEESEENEILGFGVKEIINCIVMAVGVCLYMILLKYIGFVIASALMLFISMYIAKIRGVILPLLAIGFPWALKLLFWYALEVRLP